MHWALTRFRGGRKCGKQTTKARSLVFFFFFFMMNAAWSGFFHFSCAHLKHTVQLQSIIVLCSFESKGETGMSN